MASQAKEINQINKEKIHMVELTEWHRFLSWYP
jgi:hypothetical protein